ISGTVGEAASWGAPVANYHFEESSGATFYDSTGAGNNATCAICPTSTTGVFGNARRFSKTSSTALTVPNTSTLETSTATLSAWIKPTWTASSNSYNPAILALRSSSGTRYSWQIADTYQTMLISNGSTTKSVAITMSANTWYHVAVVEDGTTWTGYVNGIGVGSATQSFGSTTGLPLNIGSSTGSADYFTGDIDEVQIYNRALSAHEVYALAQSTVAGVSSAQLAFEAVDITDT